MAVAISENHVFLADYEGGLGIYEFVDEEIPPERPILIVPLAARYFELVSTFLEPNVPDAAEVFGEIQDLVIVCQNDGGIFIPPNINTIERFEVTQGYQIFCSDTSSWVSTGEPIGFDRIYRISAHTWSWIGYPFDTEMAADFVLSSIANNIRIVITDDGRYWIPGLVNSLGNMRPGEGYMVFSDWNVDFQYIGGEGMLMSGDVLKNPNYLSQTTSSPGQPVDSPQPTGLPYAVVAHISAGLRAQYPAFIELYDGRLLVGKAKVMPESEIVPLAAWKGSTEQNLPGFKTGHPITAKVFSTDGTLLTTQESGRFGEDAFTVVNLDFPDNNLPTNFFVDSVYPNPFNSTVIIQLSLPTAGVVSINIFNLIGNSVYETSYFYNSGQHLFRIDFNSLSQELVSGMYFTKVGFDHQTATCKVIYLR